ncbi:citrate transporter [Lysinibacillus alkalisoli]|uniref:Citrate transporter n=1 Tax=Lysinibacillus alkalisoli TaxID=1911548 RepID=A0A917LFQ8_9BACI|nr:citrate:proton symporter [Lysinibacillus alkalisoli]GGG20096.1 citrate transporter [Lysinibacillus alkalisoli]
MLSMVGFIAITAIIILLISNRVTPIVALVLVPIVAALITGFSASEIGEFFTTGLGSVMNVVVMFIFAILYFGIMQDVGLFNPLIHFMIKISRGNIIAVAVATVVIAAVAHLDGSGASTFLITIPALLPLYKRLRMSPYLLLLLVGLSASIMNMVPWAGPLGRAGSVINMDPTTLWRPLIPVQLTGLGLLVGLAVLLALREKRRIAKLPVLLDDNVQDEPATVQEKSEFERPKLLWLNALITVGVIAMLVQGSVPAGFVFMVGLSIALPINFHSVDDQMARIKAHAPGALMMASIILAAGSFLGILNGTGMLDAIATDLVKLLPVAVIPFLHIIIGIFGVPFDLALSTDAYYFALLPIVEQIVTDYGVSSVSAVNALVIGNIIGTFVSPFSPALWLALGLAGLEMGKHIRYSFLIMWLFSITLVVFAIIIGVIGM